MIALGAAIAVLDPDGESAVGGTPGVYLHVEITPRECIESCGGGWLPTTGAGMPEIPLAIGILLLVVGVTVIVINTIRRRRSPA